MTIIIKTIDGKEETKEITEKELTQILRNSKIIAGKIVYSK